MSKAGVCLHCRYDSVQLIYFVIIITIITTHVYQIPVPPSIMYMCI